MKNNQDGHCGSPAATRRAFLKHVGAASFGVAGGGMGLFAPNVVPRALGQSLDTVQAAVAVGSIEFLWAILKKRRIDAKHGLNVEVSFLDVNAINQGLMLGQYQVGSSQPITAAVANNAGKAITLFAPALWNNMAGVVPAGSQISSLKELLGKRIALLPPLSGVYTSTQVIAAEMGLNFQKEFDVVTGPPPAVTAFIQRGQVDAAIQIEPLVITLLLTKQYKVFLEANQVWKQLTGGDMLLGALAANQSWLDANQDVARRLTAAIVETGQIIRSDLGVFDEFASTLRLKTPEQIELAKRRLPSFYPSEWTDQSVANVQRLIARANELGIVKKPSREFVMRL